MANISVSIHNPLGLKIMALSKDKRIGITATEKGKG